MSRLRQASTAIVGSPPLGSDPTDLPTLGYGTRSGDGSLSPFAKSVPQTRVSARRGEARNQPEAPSNLRRVTYQTPKTIGEVVRLIERRAYVLPAIQREFVWDREQIEELFDSLLREYPIGVLFGRSPNRFNPATSSTTL